MAWYFEPSSWIELHQAPSCAIPVSVTTTLTAVVIIPPQARRSTWCSSILSVAPTPMGMRAGPSYDSLLLGRSYPTVVFAPAAGFNLRPALYFGFENANTSSFLWVTRSHGSICVEFASTVASAPSTAVSLPGARFGLAPAVTSLFSPPISLWVALRLAIFRNAPVACVTFTIASSPPVLPGVATRSSSPVPGEATNTTNTTLPSSGSEGPNRHESPGNSPTQNSRSLDPYQARDLSSSTRMLEGRGSAPSRAIDVDDPGLSRASVSATPLSDEDESQELQSVPTTREEAAPGSALVDSDSGLEKLWFYPGSALPRSLDGHYLHRSLLLRDMRRSHVVALHTLMRAHLLRVLPASIFPGPTSRETREDQGPMLSPRTHVLQKHPHNAARKGPPEKRDQRSWQSPACPLCRDDYQVNSPPRVDYVLRGYIRQVSIELQEQLDARGVVPGGHSACRQIIFGAAALLTPLQYLIYTVSRSGYTPTSNVNSPDPSYNDLLFFKSDRTVRFSIHTWCWSSSDNAAWLRIFNDRRSSAWISSLGTGRSIRQGMASLEGMTTRRCSRHPLFKPDMTMSMAGQPGGVGQNCTDNAISVRAEKAGKQAPSSGGSRSTYEYAKMPYTYLQQYSCED
ncbi:hypothetical protein FA13DRAFT_1712676 [Coprinellus micaceus]|uniref:Uncharacterized protein n=1 Tax=Coprinellus micaceus TaxID=71717 RepID=A0A4Y7T001_COPMI|nr:hypothetical protein FA13DRAFT_1712676 [Coprinellus micaceus]